MSVASARVWIVYTYGKGVLSAYRNREDAETAARVLSEHEPLVNFDVKVAIVDLNQMLDVSSNETVVKPYCSFVVGVQRELGRG